MAEDTPIFRRSAAFFCDSYLQMGQDYIPNHTCNDYSTISIPNFQQLPVFQQPIKTLRARSPIRDIDERPLVDIQLFGAIYNDSPDLFIKYLQGRYKVATVRYPPGGNIARNHVYDHGSPCQRYSKVESHRWVSEFSLEFM